MTKKEKIDEIVNSRYIENIFPSKEALRRVLKSGGKLLFYIGVDPTAPKLHLGHSTNFLLLRKIQELGHKVILLVGDFTARIGDPTGKDETRKPLSKEEVLKNCKTYKQQAEKILDFSSKFNPAEIRYNSKWLSKMKPEDFIKLMTQSTVSKMIQRDMFQKRIKERREIYLHEFLYPLLQGYDSVAMNIDVEVGGNDQTFNMLIGRDLLKKYKNKEKIVIATKLLINPKTGKKLMSKSEGGFVALNDKSSDMYGKIMALPDEVIITCFNLCTEMPQSEIKKIEKGLKSKKLNPRDAKAKLAKEIVTMYHGKEAAKKSEKEFDKIFKQKKLPTKMPTFVIVQKTYPPLDLLFALKLVNSKNEAKRVITQGGMRIDGKVEKSWKKDIKIKKGMVIQVGRRKFAKIKTP
jgi:tyrosyl-tRNA synthetase